MKNKKLVLAALMELAILGCTSGDGGRGSSGLLPEDGNDYSRNGKTPVNPNLPSNTENPSISGNNIPSNNTDNPGSPSPDPNKGSNPDNGSIIPGNPGNPANPVPVPPVVHPIAPPVYKMKEDPDRFKIEFTENPDIFRVHTPETALVDNGNPFLLKPDGDIITTSTDEKYVGTKVVATKNPATGKYGPSYEKTLQIYDNVEMKGKNSVGVYSYGGNVILEWSGNVKVGEGSVGIYALANDEYKDTPNGQNTNTTVSIDGTIQIEGPNSVGVYYKSGDFDSIGVVINTGKIESSAVNATGIFTDSGGSKKVFKNENEITLNGDKSVGMYGAGNGGYELVNTSSGTITVGDSSDSNNPSIGMYTDKEKVRLLNEGSPATWRGTGTIKVGKNSVGMMKSKGTGADERDPHIKNDQWAVIELAGDGAIGMVLGDGVYGENEGKIKTVSVNGKNPKGVIGVIAGKNSRFRNAGTIEINSPGGTAILKAGGTIINEGTITVSDGAVDEREAIASDPDLLSAHKFFSPTLPRESSRLYVDTEGKTNPIEGMASTGIEKVNLVMGAEAASGTNETEIKVDRNILSRYNKSLEGGSVKEVDVQSDALLWDAEAKTEGSEVKDVTLKKKSYTEFAEDGESLKVATGLDQRYGANTPGSQEKELFNSLNSLNTGQRELLSRTFKEVSGSQYIKVQERIREAGEMIENQISELQSDADDENGKIKAFTTRGRSSSRTDEVPEHISTAFGAAYLQPDAVDRIGWYAGASVERFKMKDSGGSMEHISMVRGGAYKKFALGDAEWTIAGEGFFSRSQTERRYIVMDTVYTGEAGYSSYGLAMKNEIGKKFTVADTITVKPYAAINAEYGKFSDIREKNGVLKLEIKGNDYYSIKPEAGIQFSYIQPLLSNSSLSTSLGLGYEYELGNVYNTVNNARFIGTDTEWFRLKGEKTDEKGNFKASLKIGFNAGNYGLSVNGGYGTRGRNAHVGIGFTAVLE